MTYFQRVRSIKYLELLGFYILLVSQLVPLFSAKYFPTADGPAHLYNAQIILDLVFNSESVYKSCFQLNANFNPNWMGHIILAVFIYVFNPIVAEKIIIGLIIIGIPFMMRKIIYQTNPENVLVSWLFLPFSYSYLLTFGFYNFFIGILLLTMVLLWMIKDRKTPAKTPISLFMLASLIVLSHVFVFAVFLVVFTIFYFNELVHRERSIVSKIVAISPGIIFAIVFFTTGEGESLQIVWTDSYEKLKSILYAGPVLAMNIPREMRLSWIVFTLFMLLTVNSLVRSIWNSGPTSDAMKWIFIFLSILAFYFIFPSSLKPSVGFIDRRFLYFLFLFWLIALSYFPLQAWIKAFIIFLIIYISVDYIKIGVKTNWERNALCEELDIVADKLEENSTVLPIINKSHYYQSSIFNYLSCEKDLIVLYNYEASMHHFPIEWNIKTMPYYVLNEDVTLESSIRHFPVNMESTQEKIKYVLILFDADFQSGLVKKKLYLELDNSYQLIYSSNKLDLKLFKSK